MTFCCNVGWICALFLSTIFSSVVSGKYGGGSGAADDPYLIFTPAQLSQIGNYPDDWDKNFKLAADVDMSNYSGSPGEPAFAIIGYLQWQPYTSKPFKGTFDGNRKRIINLSITTDGRDFVGLFGFIHGSAASVKNIVLVKPKIDAGNGMFVGAIAGRLKTGTITNCKVEQADVTGGNSVGGLAGYNTSGKISGCGVNANVSGNINVGGVAGYHAGVELIRCSFTGNVFGLDDVGAIAGESDGQISSCGANADVIAAGDKVGGLVGTLRGSAKYCFAKGVVEGLNEIGGLVGRNTGLVGNCYARGDVGGDSYVGGLTGLLYNAGVVSKSYTVCQIDATLWGEVSPAVRHAAHLADEQNGAGQFIGWTEQGSVTASFWPENDYDLLEMKSRDFYIAAGWDFVGESENGNLDLWDICDGTGFPRLSWQGWPSGDFECPEGVDVNDIAILAEEWLSKVPTLDLAGGLGDYVVNFRDLSGLALAWQTKAGQSAYNPACDLSPDGSVNVLDLAVMAKNWLATGYSKADVSDVRGDGLVDFADWAVFARAWKTLTGSKNWNAGCDVAPVGGDGVIDLDDLAEFAYRWLETGAGFADIAPADQPDGIVNLRDFTLAAENYLKQE